MHMKNQSSRVMGGLFSAAVSLWLVALPAAAATQEISAVFKPDPNNPLVN